MDAEAKPEIRDVGDKFVYFGNLFPHEPQYRSGRFVGLALQPQFDRDIPHDAKAKLPFADGSIVGFQSQDVFEHIPYDAIVPILDDIFRCLKTGGPFRLSVPDYHSPLLRNRSIYDANGQILCDLAMGGRVSSEKSGAIKVSWAGGDGYAHVWFPTYAKLVRLILASDLRRCASIAVHHAWFDAHDYICEPFDQSVMPVSRTPPNDMRADGKPISLVVDFIK